MEVTPTSRKGTLGTWWFHWSTGWVGHSADNEPYVGDGTRLWANHGSWGVCESELEPHQTGKAQGRKTKTPNRTWEIRPSGIIGGPRETWSWRKWEPILQPKGQGW